MSNNNDDSNITSTTQEDIDFLLVDDAGELLLSTGEMPSLANPGVDISNNLSTFHYPQQLMGNVQNGTSNPPQSIKAFNSVQNAPLHTQLGGVYVNPMPTPQGGQQQNVWNNPALINHHHQQQQQQQHIQQQPQHHQQHIQQQQILPPNDPGVNFGQQQVFYVNAPIPVNNMPQPFIHTMTHPGIVTQIDASQMNYGNGTFMSNPNIQFQPQQIQPINGMPGVGIQQTIPPYGLPQASLENQSSKDFKTTMYPIQVNNRITKMKPAAYVDNNIMNIDTAEVNGNDSSNTNTSVPTAMSLMSILPNNSQAESRNSTLQNMVSSNPSIVSNTALKSDSNSHSSPNENNDANDEPRLTSAKEGKSMSKQNLENMTPEARRRHERNMREQQRSYKISQQIKELRTVLNESNIPFKPNKFSILMSIVSFIKQLQSRAILLESEHKKLVKTIAHTAEIVKSGKTIQSLIPNTKDKSNHVKDPDLLVVQGINYKSVFEQCNVALGVAALDGRFLDCNEEFTNISGLSKEQIKQQSLFNLLKSGDMHSVYSMMGQLLKDNTQNSNEPNPLEFWSGSISNSGGVSDVSSTFEFTLLPHTIEM